MKALVVVLALCTVAHAEDIKLPRSVAILHVPTGWHRIDNASVVAAYKTDAGLTLAVTRAQLANPAAWNTRTRDAYMTQIEKGALKGMKRTARKVSEASGVPALDLEARRDDGSTLVLRVLAFRTYAMSVAVDVPRGGSLADARAVTTAFAPPADYKP